MQIKHGCQSEFDFIWMVVANLGSGCAVKTSNLKHGSWDLKFLPINTIIYFDGQISSLGWLTDVEGH